MRMRIFSGERHSVGSGAQREKLLGPGEERNTKLVVFCGGKCCDEGQAEVWVQSPQHYPGIVGEICRGR